MTKLPLPDHVTHHFGSHFETHEDTATSSLQSSSRYQLHWHRCSGCTSHACPPPSTKVPYKHGSVLWHGRDPTEMKSTSSSSSSAAAAATVFPVHIQTNITSDLCCWLLRHLSSIQCEDRLRGTVIEL